MDSLRQLHKSTISKKKKKQASVAVKNRKADSKELDGTVHNEPSCTTPHCLQNTYILIYRATTVFLQARIKMVFASQSPRKTILTAWWNLKWSICTLWDFLHMKGSPYLMYFVEILGTLCAISLYQVIHTKLFITLFVITQFWI